MNAARIKAIALVATLSLTGSLVEAQSPLTLDKSTELTSPTSKVADSPFLRVARDANGAPKSLQTSITRFKSADGRILVDLIGAVHIGEREYYRRLNKQFSQYDAVLYELVAPQGTRVPADGKRDAGINPISWLQNSTKQMLGLQSQLELIDYQPDNFVHADLSPSQMAEKMAQRGDTPLTVGLSAISEIIRQQNLAAKQQPSDASANQFAPANLQDMFELLGNPMELKRMMALQFISNGSIDMGLGKTLNQLLVVDRNQAALRVLQKQLLKGKTKIGIFYGAAHMPDFAKRLTEQFELKKTQHVWVDAWNLTRAPKSNNNHSDPTTMMMKLLENLGN